jgi:hypothetical protein
MAILETDPVNSDSKMQRGTAMPEVIAALVVSLVLSAMAAFTSPGSDTGATKAAVVAEVSR